MPCAPCNSPCERGSSEAAPRQRTCRPRGQTETRTLRGESRMAFFSAVSACSARDSEGKYAAAATKVEFDRRARGARRAIKFSALPPRLGVSALEGNLTCLYHIRL